MSPLRRHTALALLASAALACGEGPTPPLPPAQLPRPLTSGEAQLVAADNGFAFRLFGAIAVPGATTNLFISPLSVGMALGMAYNGAAGATADTMRLTLGFDGLTRDEINASYRSLIDLLRGLDPSVEFAIANSVWYRPDFALDSAYLDRTERYFDAAVRPLDFASPDAAPTINQWVSDATHGRITSIVDAPIPPDAIAYLINAIYFKGAWTYQFPGDATRPGPFYRADGTTRDVPMMRTPKPIPVQHAWTSDAEILDLPYGGGTYSMTIVLPAVGVELDSLVGALTQQQWDGWIGALDSTSLLVTMPKFQIAYEKSLVDALEALGMKVAFCRNVPAYNPDFTAMYPPGGACISNVKHKTWVDVNEEGTEAAAVTSVEVGLASVPPSVTVDRPFLFAIRERLSGTILFIGTIADPGA
jgi:serine protease inhibitor